MKHFQPGVWLPRNAYRYFKPSPIFREWTVEDPYVIHLLDKANRMIGRLDMFSDYVPNIDAFIQMHVRKEAVLSSKIEGTQTNMEEALQEKQYIPQERRNDWQEVQNYLEALNWAIAQLAHFPISTRLIREAHRRLIAGVRGKHKEPGEFRRSQNWIGGASLNDARFIPPVHEDISELMGDMERFLHKENDTFPELLRIALMHYQFETIHPFLDGNGRIGRVLIPLYLVSRKILKKPVLYLSQFFEKNRDLYYENLTLVRTRGELAQWFKFFLEGVVQTAERGVQTLDAVLKLEKETREKVKGLGARAANAQRVVDYLYKQPYLFDIDTVARVAKISPASAYRLRGDLARLGVIEVRPGHAVFRAYLDVFTQD